MFEIIFAIILIVFIVLYAIVKIKTRKTIDDEITDNRKDYFSSKVK